MAAMLAPVVEGVTVLAQAALPPALGDPFLHAEMRARIEHARFSTKGRLRIGVRVTVTVVVRHFFHRIRHEARL